MLVRLDVNVGGAFVDGFDEQIMDEPDDGGFLGLLDLVGGPRGGWGISRCGVESLEGVSPDAEVGADEGVEFLLIGEDEIDRPPRGEPYFVDGGGIERIGGGDGEAVALACDGDAAESVDEFGWKGLQDALGRGDLGKIDDGHSELLAHGGEDSGAVEECEADEDAVEAFAGGALLVERALGVCLGEEPAFDEEGVEPHGRSAPQRGCGEGAGGAIGFPDGDASEFGVGAGLADARGEEVEADHRDILDAGRDALAGAELVGVDVEVFVVEAFDDGLVGDAFNVGRAEGGAAVARKSDGDAGLDLVVVPVAGGVVALAEERDVLLGAEGRDVEAVRGGEVELLADERDLGQMHAGLHGKEGRELEPEREPEAGQLSGQSLEGGGESIGWCGAAMDGVGEVGHDGAMEGLIDVLDVDHVAPIDADGPDAADLELQMEAPRVGRGMAGVAVVTSAGPVAVGSEVDADGSAERPGMILRGLVGGASARFGVHQGHA